MTYVSHRLLELGPVEVLFIAEADTPHRRAYTPDDDVSDLPPEVQAEIAAHWTPERVSAWRALVGSVDNP